jgi:hypothetical protein
VVLTHNADNMNLAQKISSTKRRLALSILVLGMMGASLDQSASAQSAGSSGLTQIARIDAKSLANAITEPAIQAFDISPDGTLLASLVRSTSGDNAQIWLVIEEIKTGAIVKQLKMGPNSAILSDYAQHVRFTRDQKFLVVQDLQRVEVLETTDYKLLGKIQAPAGDKLNVPVAILPASESDIFAVSFGTGQRGPFEVGIDPVEVLIADVSRGKLISDWQASDIPESISPTGALVALSDWNVENPLLSVQIIDAKTGKKMASLKGGYSFAQNASYTDVVGEVIGKFVSETEILLTPNESWDATGHYAGKSLKEVQLAANGATPGEGKALREFIPANYGPTGEVVVAANRQMFVTTSCYLSPEAATHSEPLPPESGCELLGFSFKQSEPIFAAKVASRGLEANAAGEMLRPKLSSDGAVIAIAQDEGVTILARK